MGLRSRLRNRIKKALGGERPGTPVVPPHTRDAVGAPAELPGSLSTEMPRETTPSAPAPEPARPDSALDSPGPQGPAAKKSQGDAAERTAPEGEAPPVPEPPPDPVPEAPSASSANIAVAQVFASDYATDDAPVRNAHYADAFETTDEAMTVRVYAKALELDAEFLVEPGEFVLDAAERAGHELPFSCRSGGCLSCSARLEAGTTQMEEQYVLEEEHIDAGYRLLCLTTVESACVFETDVQEDIE